jgi:hypothetical protein
MLDEVEVGRHYKGCGRSAARLALVTTGICLALAFTSRLRTPVSLCSVLLTCVEGKETTHTFV